MLLLSLLLVHQGHTNDTLYCSGEEDEVCGGGDLTLTLTITITKTKTVIEMPNPSENLRRRKDLSPFLFHFTKGDDAEAIIRTIVQESKLKSDVGYICFTERPLIMCDDMMAYFKISSSG